MIRSTFHTFRYILSLNPLVCSEGVLEFVWLGAVQLGVHVASRSKCDVDYGFGESVRKTRKRHHEEVEERPFLVSRTNMLQHAAASGYILYVGRIPIGPSVKAAIGKDGAFRKSVARV